MDRAHTTSGSVPADRPHLKHWPARLPRELALPETSLYANLVRVVDRHPDKSAHVFLGRHTTYRELQAQAEAVAGWLQAVGVRAGDRVGIYLQNCPQTIAACYGILRADAVMVPINPMHKPSELALCLADAGLRVVVAASDLLSNVVEADAMLPAADRLAHVLVVRYADALPASLPADLPVPPAMAQWLQADAPAVDTGGLAVTHWQDALSAGHRPAPPVAGPDDLALLAYTSGTTGVPKGCMHTHRTLMCNAVGSGPWRCAGPESVALGAAPLFHITGMVHGVLGAVWLGSTTVLMPRWDRMLAAALIARHRVTHWNAMPTMVIDLFGGPDAARFDLSSLRHLSGGGMAMPQAVAERLRDGFGLTFSESYGLTETAAPTHGNPPERAKPQCLGMPIYGVDSRVVDPDTLAELPPGEMGEIVTHGPMLFKGYWRRPDATAAAFVSIQGDDKRFFRTGDLGRMDEDGYFFLVDRLKRMINASGFKVWPAEVEATLGGHPGVHEVCVIAMPDAYRGESVKAVVVRRGDQPPWDGQELIDWARERMAAYKLPREVEFVDALPKSGTGKPMWRALQEREAARCRGGA